MKWIIGLILGLSLLALMKMSYNLGYKIGQASITIKTVETLDKDIQQIVELKKQGFKPQINWTR